ncbi:MAG TPA: class I adenylate-forming enzyme family protein [Stellaceae bacterium]|nr:class I adenylate-forming enzyme family protein [Stellaceae bacterium]
MSTILTLHDPATARQYYAAGVWQADTLYSLLARHAAVRPGAFALRDGALRLSWARLLRWVDAVAGELHAAGLRRGDRVSVWLPNRAETVVVLLACARNGYVCNPSLHRSYAAPEIAELIAGIQAASLIAQPGYGAPSPGPDIFAAAQAVPSLRRVYRVAPRGGADAAEGTAHPFPGPDAAAPQPPPPDDNPDKVVYLAFTSGTTGAPKGVLHSDNTLLANGRAMVADWGHDPRTILLSLSPLSHHIATVAVEQMLVAGLELVTNDPPDGMSALDWLIETGATYVMGVPTHAMDMLEAMRRRGLARLGAVKIFYMAGAPIPRETAQAFLDLGITPQNIYGMTENGSHQYTLPTDDARTIVETCGRAGLGYEVRIFKAEDPDTEAAPGEVGEIGGRGGMLTLGYFGNQAATEASFNRHGWFMSGDLGRLDENGCLEILGRKKELIIRGGHNVYPARIEDLALRHPGVARVAAFAVPDRRLGEKVCLAIVPRDGAAPAPMAVLAHLRAEGLSIYDMPEYFVALDEFPLTASGKVLKRALVEWARTERIRLMPVQWSEKRGA